MSFRIRDSHWELIFEYMSRHPDFCRGRINSMESRRAYNKMWAELTDDLNSLGFGQKATEKWQKSWSDFKVSLKKKAAEIHRNRNLTGGGPGVQKELTEFELKILSILGETFYKGVGATEVGIPHQQIFKPKIQELAAIHSFTYPTPSPTSEPTTTPEVPEPTPSTSGTFSSTEKENQVPVHQSLPFRKIQKSNIGIKIPTDHEYLANLPRKVPKKNEDNFTELYKETVTTLKDIKFTLQTNLQETNKNINLIAEKLDLIVQELNAVREGFSHSVI